MCIIDEFGFKKEHKFSTLTSDLLLLRESLLDSGVRYVVMESTGIYWIFIWRLLVDHFEVKPVNPLFIKQLPERKSDVRDAHWIAIVLIAWATSRTKKSRLGIKYQELKKRMSPQKALAAIARKLWVIIWNVLVKKETYRMSGAEIA